MINDVLYNSILRMVLKRIKYMEVGNMQASAVPLMTSENPDQVDNSLDLTNPYDIIKLDNFDYHLLYNTEEDVIGVTSNNGEWRWTLDKDMFDDLISVTVLNPYVPFKIALIFENYDQRKDPIDVDDKGKLTDVILLGIDNTALAKSLVIEPANLVINVGETAKFSALLGLQNGSTVEVTTESAWGIKDPPSNTEIQIEDGVVTNAEPGTYRVLASCQGVQSEAILEVDELITAIYPGDSIVDINEEFDFNLNLISNDGSLTPVTEGVIWKITSLDSSGSLPTIDDNGHVSDTSSAGRFLVTATYQGSTSSCELGVIAPSLSIDPAVITIYEGDFTKFNALYVTTTVNSGVTYDCDWSINSNDLEIDNIGNKGYVDNTYGHTGEYSIQAEYNGLKATARLIVLPKQLFILPANVIADINSKVNFKAFRETSEGIRTDVTESVEWNIESPCVISNNSEDTPKGTVANLIQSGKFGVSASYPPDLQATAILTVIDKTLKITVDSATIKVNEQYKFYAQVTNTDGVTDVTSLCEWSISSNAGLITDGVVSRVDTPGEYTVTAKYNGMTSTCNLTVEDFEFVLIPSEVTINEGDKVTFQANAGDLNVSENLECTWNTNDSSISIIGGVINDLFTILDPPDVTVTATYKDKIAIAVIHVKKSNLRIIPETSAVVLNQTQQFRAYLGNDSKNVDITSSCDWVINGPLIISELGEVGNTIKVGTYSVTATYRKNRDIMSMATIQVAERAIIVHSSQLTVQLRDWGTLDGDAVQLKLNELDWSDTIELTSDWKDHIINLNNGVNLLTFGAVKNSSLLPNDNENSVTLGIRVIDETGNVIVPESLISIDCPNGDNLSPEDYNKSWSILLN